ncbi:hypothetical protein ACFS27_03235 [Promicromonospora vindobonensis]|uniref:Uncharacterized protein n=1 Tax=Promicromonospora vindobonensis TaxID=195748 RepID=A0ABW5VNN5_9MICO
MNTQIGYAPTEPEPQAYVDEVPKAGLYVVDHGDIHDARKIRPEQFTVCFCSDDQHRDSQADAWGTHTSEARAERVAQAMLGHVLARELYAVTRVVRR